MITQTQADTTTFQFAYTLDASGKITQADVTRPGGAVRRVTFNAAGYTLSDTLPLGQPEQQTLTLERQAGTNLVLAATDPLGRRTAYAYDALGNVASITRLAGTAQAATTSFTWEATFSQLTAVTDPRGRITRYAYGVIRRGGGGRSGRGARRRGG